MEVKNKTSSARKDTEPAQGEAPKPASNRNASPLVGQALK